MLLGFLFKAVDPIGGKVVNKIDDTADCPGDRISHVDKYDVAFEPHYDSYINYA